MFSLPCLHRVFLFSLLLPRSTVASTGLSGDGTPVALTGTYVVSAVPLSATLSPITPNETLSQRLGYLESLVSTSWNATVLTTITTSNNGLTSALSLENPGYSSSNLWNICALVFSILPTASTVSNPYYGSGNCSALFNETCVVDLLMAVYAQSDFSHDICGGAKQLQLRPNFNHCGEAWDIVDDQLSRSLALLFSRKIYFSSNPFCIFLLLNATV
jgi:hypothetical protein